MGNLATSIRTRRTAPLTVAVLLGGLGVLVVATLPVGSSAASSRSALTASVIVGQTCPERLPPGSRADIVGSVRNTGDEVLRVTRFDADAGTPGNESDDFLLTYQSGDVNGNGLLDPGETHRYTGSYTLGDEDSTNIVGVDAVSTLGNPADDIQECTTDVIQPPAPGELAGVVPVRGQVLIRVPGSDRFVLLAHVTEIPVGTTVDATRGTVRLVSAVTATQTNSAEFFDGIFTIRQRRANRAVMQLILGGGNFGLCRRRTSSASSVDSPAARRPPRRPVRRLWGSGKGRFQTRGRYSSATVRGTRWLVVDRCDGTLTRVTQGVVLVLDFKRRKSVLVRAGRSYLARA
ncbi:MAG TPA: hypothetical protein VE615_13150 [Gaiellaceae bacterium]|jgi:hypothetical protein|nr:hypothetical protein [Gaiellaceae bacterium]